MSKPVVLIVTPSDPAITSPSPWVTSLMGQLDADFEVALRHLPDGYMKQLIDERVALVFLDGERDDWQAWTTAPASSTATRRIPILLISQTIEAGRGRASGALDVLSPAQLIDAGADIAHRYARRVTPEQQAQLDCDCQKPLPALAREGIAKFNAGEYYAQHDLFEALWVATESPVRDLYRAILQVGVAYYQLERGNYRGALKMLERSVQWLLILPDTCQGVDVAQLRADSFAVRQALEALGTERWHTFDMTFIKGVVWEDDALSHD